MLYSLKEILYRLMKIIMNGSRISSNTSSNIESIIFATSADARMLGYKDAPLFPGLVIG